MSEQPSSTPPSATDVQNQLVSIQGRQYDPGLLAGLGIWYLIFFLMMFSGQALFDTIGLFALIIETLALLALDRPGLLSMRGLVNREQLSGGQRILLNIGEVVFFFFMTGAYLVRTIMEYQRIMSAQPPKTPGEQPGVKK